MASNKNNGLKSGPHQPALQQSIDSNTKRNTTQQSATKKSRSTMASNKSNGLISGPIQVAFQESRLPQDKSNHLNLEFSKNQMAHVLSNKTPGKDIWFENSKTLHKCLEELRSTGWKKMGLNAWMASVVSTTQAAEKIHNKARKMAQNHDEAAGELLEQDSSHKTQIQNQKKMARKVAKEGKQKARKRMGTTEKDHRGVNRQISVFIVAEKKEDMPQLMALPINTQLETNCGLNEKVWERFFQKMVLMDVQGIAQGEKETKRQWNLTKKYLTTKLKLLTWLLGTKKVPEGKGITAELVGDYWLKEWDSLITPMMVMPENGGGVTKFEGQWPKVCEKVDECLAVCRSMVDKHLADLDKKNLPKKPPRI